MKKLVIAAVAALCAVGGWAASLSPIDCTGTLEASDECPVIAFKLTGNGKTVADINDGAYKAVKTLKIKKGALALFPNDECADESLCCYDTGAIYAKIKIGNETKDIAIEGLEIGKWSIFGKNFDSKVRDYTHTMKKGSSTKLESDLFVSGEEIDVFGDDDEELGIVSIWASAFGNMKAELSKKTVVDESCCNPVVTSEECVLTFTPGKYTGWFVGQRELLSDGWCFNCVCGEYDIFGGTWTASYLPKLQTIDATQRFVFGKVLADVDED